MRLSGLLVLGLAVLLLGGGWLLTKQSEVDPAPGSPPQGAAPSSSPEAVVVAYLDAMAAGQTSAELEIYTAATRRMMRDRPMAPGPMRALAAAYRGCRPERVLTSASRAVVRYAMSQRQCAPFFLVQGAQGWQLDLAGMSRAIGFNTRNEWRFVNGVPVAAAFAFRDWRFDPQGFPQP